MHTKHNPAVIESGSHFNAVVPQALRDKLLELAEAAKADFISDLPGWPEPYGTAGISAIYGYDPGGFMPFQLGGYEISELYRSDIDSTYHISKAQSDAMIEQEKYLYQCTRFDFSDELEKFFGKGKVPDAEKLCYADFEAAGLENEFSDYESEFFEPALLRLEIWVDDSKDERGMIQAGKAPDSVYVCLGLNYTDQPYYRSKSDETLFSFNLPVADVMAMSAEDFTKRLLTEYEKGEF